MSCLAAGAPVVLSFFWYDYLLIPAEFFQPKLIISFEGLCCCFFPSSLKCVAEKQFKTEHSVCLCEFSIIQRVMLYSWSLLWGSIVVKHRTGKCWSFMHLSVCTVRGSRGRGWRRQKAEQETEESGSAVPEVPGPLPWLPPTTHPHLDLTGWGGHQSW